MSCHLRATIHILLLVLALSELPEGVLLGLHVTVVGEVGVVGTALVLQGLDRCREVDLTLEELLR